MFHPQEMTEVELVVPEKHILKVISYLADFGVFHQTDTSYLSSDAGLDSAKDWRAKSAAFASLEHRLLSAMKILGIEEGEPSNQEISALTEVDAVLPTTQKLENEVQEVVEELTNQQKELAKLEHYMQQLQPVAEVGINLDALQNLRYLYGMIGLMPTDNVERLKTSLVRVPFVLLTLEQNQEQAVVLLCGPRQNADILERAARSAYLNPLNLPQDYHGTPQQVLEAMQAKVAYIQQHIDEQKAELDKLRQTRKDQFQSLLWRTRISHMMADAMSQFGKLQYTYLVVGWIPSDQFAQVSRKLNQISDDIVIESHVPERGEKDQNIPVSLKNKGLFGAFQALVTTYGKPRYEEVDPTILLAITFPLLFGAMFGDVGHGLILALLGGLLASGKVKALRSMSSFGTIIIISGFSAVGFGFLYGSVFGLETLLPAIWLRPMENILQILIITVMGGVVILNLAYLINFLNAWKSRDWGRLLLGSTGISGLLLYWSLIGLAASLLQKKVPLPTPLFVILAIIASLLVMFSDILKNLLEHRRPLIEGGITTYAIQSFFELFETLISLFSNSLSYVRVGAFAVAHAGLSAVIYILANMVSATQGPGYWITLVIGNIFIIGFEGMIVGIQTLRLEYYEFLSKFFTGGGKSFLPLKLNKS
jgi:V/A-type H+/Na+-transporting ATPase subunit I